MRFISYLSVIMLIAAGIGWPWAFTNSIITPKLDDFFQNPELIGPESACMNGSFIFVNFSGAGDPATDRYVWRITDADGFELYYQAGGEEVQNIQFPFTSTGRFNVSLSVTRGGNQNFFSQTKQITVARAPRFLLSPDVIVCGSEPVLLQALDTNDPDFSSYAIEWISGSGQALGTGNTYLATEPGTYRARVISDVCEATGSTFIGPSIEVNVIPSATRVCLGQTVSYTPDAPFLGRWSYQKEGQSERVFLEESFTLALNSRDLEGLGKYNIFFNVEDPDRPGCSVEKKFDLTVEENAGSFTVNKISDSDGCDVSNGSFEITTTSAFDFIIIGNFPNGTLSNVSANTTTTISALAPGLYTVAGRIGNCTVTRTINIGNTDPDDAIDFSVTARPQTCSANGIDLGTLIIDFNGVNQSGRYRIVSNTGNVISRGFQNQSQLSVDVPAGRYQVEVRDNNNCVSTNSIIYEVGGNSQVNFSIPGEITACQFYELTPESTENLNYTLRRPDGSETLGSSGQGFMLNQNGTYQLTGRPTGTNLPLCPRTRTFDVIINEPLEFDVVIEQVDCFGNQFITADLFGRDPNSVIMRWYSESGLIVGRQQMFRPPSPGTFFLEVQPRASSRCDLQPISFEVKVPLRETEVTLDGAPFCEEDFSTTLAMTAGNPDIVKSIEWFRIDDQGGKEWLSEFEDQSSIDVIDEGVYEVVVRNQIGCRLGDAVFEVKRSESVQVELEDTYRICSAENIFPVLDPGEFSEVNWYLEGNLLSNAKNHKIDAPGTYELIVTNEKGCNQVKEFEVIEDCMLMIRHPDAMVVGDPVRDFRVYANEDIDEVEVFIYQRTGELIFHSINVGTNPNLPVITWDGYLNGRAVSVGTYPILIHYKSKSLAIEKVLRKSLVVIK